MGPIAGLSASHHITSHHDVRMFVITLWLSPHIRQVGIFPCMMDDRDKRIIPPDKVDEIGVNLDGPPPSRWPLRPSNLVYRPSNGYRRSQSVRQRPSKRDCQTWFVRIRPSNKACPWCCLNSLEARVDWYVLHIGHIRVTPCHS